MDKNSEKADKNEKKIKFSFPFYWSLGVARSEILGYENQLRDQLKGKPFDPDVGYWNFMFSSKFVCVPGFRKHVLLKISKDQKIKDRMLFILKRIFASMAHTSGNKDYKNSPEYFLWGADETDQISLRALAKESLQKLEKIPTSQNDDSYNSKMRKSLSDYPSIFTSSDRDNDRLREKYYDSVFTSSIGNQFEYNRASLNASVYFKQIIGESKELHLKAAITGDILSIDPDLLEDLIRFKTLALKALHYVSERRDIDSSILKDIEENLSQIVVIESMKADLDHLLANQWFMNKSTEKKHKLMEKGFPYEFSDADFATLANIISKADFDNGFVFEALIMGARGLSRFGPNPMCFKILERSKIYAEKDMQKSTIELEKSEAYLIFKDYDNMNSSAVRAEEIALRANLPYEFTISKMNQAVACHFMGKTSESKNLFHQAESKAESLSKLLVPSQFVPISEIAGQITSGSKEDLKKAIETSTARKDLFNHLIGRAIIIRDCGLQLHFVNKLLTFPEVNKDELIELNKRKSDLILTCDDKEALKEES